MNQNESVRRKSGRLDLEQVIYIDDKIKNKETVAFGMKIMLM